jgi:hypothetical protein
MDRYKLPQDADPSDMTDFEENTTEQEVEDALQNDDSNRGAPQKRGNHMAEKAVERRHNDLGDFAPPEQEVSESDRELSRGNDNPEPKIPGKPMSDMAPAGQDGAKEDI